MVSKAHRPDGSLLEMISPGRELTGVKSNLKSPGTKAFDEPRPAKKVAMLVGSARTDFAAGTLPPPSDQNSDSSESISTSDDLSPFFAHSKNRAINVVESGESWTNRGPDCTASRARCAVFRH